LRSLIKIFSFLAICILAYNTCFSQTEFGNSASNTNVIVLNTDSLSKKDSVIQFAIVKGIISAESPSFPLKAKISLIDNTEPDKIKYIYNSNENTGKYLMILTPGKEYDMIIEAKGYKPHHISIFLPRQTYFYELFQEIHFTSVYLDADKNKVGEEINVSNIFSDIFSKKYESNKITEEEKDYTKLIETLEKMIVESDSVALENFELLAIKDKIINSPNKNYSKLIEMIKSAIESSDTSSLNILNNSAISEEKTNHTYFFDKNSDNENMVMHVYGKDTIWTLPKLNTNKDVARVVEHPDKRQDIAKRHLFFDIGSSKVGELYIDDLNDIADLMRFNKKLKIEIFGFTDNIGNKDFNMQLSSKRANAVKEYLIAKKISEKRILAKGKGELSSETDSGRCRKVEIILYQ